MGKIYGKKIQGRKNENDSESPEKAINYCDY